MPEAQSLQQHSEEIELIEEDDKQSSSVVFNQQNNNFHLNQYIDPSELRELSKYDSLLANRYMDFYEKQQSHNISVDKEILIIEKGEQKARLDEMPHQRRYIFLSLYFSIGISVVSLGVAAYFASLGFPWLAGTAISVPIGVLALNLINKKSQTKLPKQKKDIKETD
jgi:uncharacterized membrane protein